MTCGIVYCIHWVDLFRHCSRFKSTVVLYWRLFSESGFPGCLVARQRWNQQFFLEWCVKKTEAGNVSTRIVGPFSILVGLHTMRLYQYEIPIGPNVSKKWKKQASGQVVKTQFCWILLDKILLDNMANKNFRIVYSHVCGVLVKSIPGVWTLQHHGPLLISPNASLYRSHKNATRVWNILLRMKVCEHFSMISG